MKTKTFLFFLTLLVSTVNAQWSTKDNIPMYNLIQAMKDSSGNVFIHTQANNGTQSYFLKYTCNGKLVYKIDSKYNRFLMSNDLFGNLYLYERNSDLVKKFDLLGNLLWEKQIPHRQFETDIYGNIVVSFMVTATYCIAKYNSEGELSWLTPTNSIDYAFFTLTNDGNIFIHGYKKITSGEFPSHTIDHLILLDQDAKIIWTKTSQKGSSSLSNVCFDEQGNIYISIEKTIYKYSKNWEELWKVDLNYISLALSISKANKLCVNGYSSDTINRKYAAVFSESGIKLWAKEFADSYTTLTSVYSNENNHFFVSGYRSKNLHFNSFVDVYNIPGEMVSHLPIDTSYYGYNRIIETFLTKDLIITIGELSTSTISVNGYFINAFKNISTDLKNDKELYSNFSLSQNYPNPFNPETTINYQLSAPGLVTLKVYDLLGREVATLVDEFKQAGNYNVKFNVETCRGKSLPSGVYFYRLQAGNYSDTKKIVLMK